MRKVRAEYTELRPNVDLRGIVDERTTEKFWTRVDKIELTGCWLWDGYINKQRYGTWSYSEAGKTKTVLVHRAAYKLLVGPIPEGLVLDHLCRVRFCCNPSHLRPVTQKQNLRRSKSGSIGASVQRSKTHCPAGHPYEGENLYVRPDGSRQCRACQRQCASKARDQRRENTGPKVRQLKPACRNGHEFTPDNTRIASGNGQRVCIECSRANLRRSRARKKAAQ